MSVKIILLVAFIKCATSAPCTEEQIEAEKACADSIFGSPEGFLNASEGETLQDLEEDCAKFRALRDCNLVPCDDSGVKTEMQYAMQYCNFTRYPGMAMCIRTLVNGIDLDHIDEPCRGNIERYLDAEIRPYPSGYGEMQTREIYCPYMTCAAPIVSELCGPGIQEVSELVDEAQCFSSPY